MRSVMFVGLVGAALISGCAPKTSGPPRVSAAACALVATYVREDLAGEFGMPLLDPIPPAKDAQASEGAGITEAFPNLAPAQATEIAAALTASGKSGLSLNCPWRSLNVAEPSTNAGDGRISLRPTLTKAGDVALLDIETRAGDIVALGARCLYRKAGEGWKKQACVPTLIENGAG